ncbi:MAG: glycosyltransferase family 4 protein [Chitinophagaceae bacterium]
MKKVIAIAPYPYLPYYSGGQKFIAQFLEYLGKEIDLTVISVAENDFALAITYKAIPLLKNSFSRYYDRSLIKKITALVKENGFDTLIIEHPYLSWLAFAIRKRTGVKVIIHTHNIEYQRFRSTGRWWWSILKGYEKRSFRKADGIFFITPEDKQFVITKWNIPPEKCFDLPFGIEINSNPTDKEKCKEFVSKKHNLNPEERILLFAGALNYKPNLDAVKILLDKINPLLLQQDSFRYKIIICGKGLPEEMKDLKSYADKNIIYAGFITDIATYYKATDIFLNPVLSGGGVKTKIVEAIAYGTTVVSTETGAAGMVKDVCGVKLHIVEDDNWEGFTNLIHKNTESVLETPSDYYKYYYWENIISNLLSVLSDKPSS